MNDQLHSLRIAGTGWKKNTHRLRVGYCIWVKHFNQYLLGRKFTIHSDHKPLQHLFGENRGVPSLASARIQHWALTLSAHNYNISYKPGKDADMLSRLPLAESYNYQKTHFFLMCIDMSCRVGNTQMTLN